MVIKMNLINSLRRRIIWILIIPFFLTGCEKEENRSRYDPPSDHTISQDGAMHKSGLNLPLTNCVVCHGSDLQGGSVQVSCYECHGKKW